MMSSWDLYWILKLDDIRFALTTMFWVLVIVSLSLVVGMTMAHNSGHIKAARRHVVAAVAVAMLNVPVSVAATMLPSTKQAAVIYVTPRMVDSKVVQEDLPELYELAKQWLREQAAEGKPAAQNHK